MTKKASEKFRKVVRLAAKYVKQGDRRDVAMKKAWKKYSSRKKRKK